MRIEDFASPSGVKVDDAVLERLSEMLELRDLGGPGSGNFDHAGRPGHEGGSAKTVYHGTAEPNLESIKERGILAEYSGRTWNLSKPGYVYATTDRDEAISWATDAADKARRSGGSFVRPVVVEVEVPVEEYNARADQDENIGDPFSDDPVVTPAIEFNGDIPPEWIKGVWVPERVPDVEGFKRNWQRRSLTAGKFVTIYVPLLLRDEFVALGGPGSGNFGHAGRPGQVGGSEPSDVVYHGTVSSSVGSIKKHGLRTKFSGRYYLDLSKTDAIYVSTDAESAAKYALSAAVRHNMEGAYGVRDAKPVVLEVRIPRSRRGLVTPDKKDDVGKPGTGFRFKGDIPPSWVTRISRVLNNPYQYGSGTPDQTPFKALEDSDVVYVPWLVEDDEDLRALGGPGSGNFGHAGRPGHEGGSAPSEEPFDALERLAKERGFRYELPSLMPGFRENPNAFKHAGSTYPTFITNDGVEIAIDQAPIFEHKGYVMVGSTRGAEKNVVTISAIVTPAEKRGAGLASKALDEFEQALDAAGMTILAEPTRMKDLVKKGQKGLTTSQLIKWYKRRGWTQAREGSDLILKREPKPRALGGKGSGYFGHAGRPGHEGGSAPSNVDFRVVNERGPMGEKFVAAIDEQMRAIPSELRLAGGSSTVIKIMKRPSNVPKGVTGMFIGGDSPGGYLRVFPSAKEDTPEEIAGTAVHEYGHAVDRWLGSKRGIRDLSTDSSFRAAAAADAKGLSPRDEWLYEHVISNPRETFAETFAAIAGAKGRLEDNATYLAKFSQSAAVLRDLLEVKP